MKYALYSLFAAAALASVSSAQAGTLTLNFSSGLNGDLGSSSHTYSLGGSSVVATVYDSTYTSGTTPTLTSITAAPTNHLFAKNDGGSGTSAESGIGTTLDGDHEIIRTDTIKVDFSALTSKQDIDLTFGSITGGEGFAIFGATGSSGATFIASGTSDSYDISAATVAAYKGVFYITEAGTDFGGNSANNILLDSAVVSVPEPSSVVMGLSSLGAIAAYGFYRRRKTVPMLAV